MAVVLPTPPIYDTSTPNDNVLKFFYKKMEHLADVTVIHDPHNFYARPKVYERFLHRMATRGERVPTENLKVGLKAIYRSPKKRTFIRGEIKRLDLEADEEVCDIFAYDYGFVEQDISIYNVYEFDYNNNLPPLALHCHLNNCKPLDGGDAWDPEAIQAFRHFAGEETVRMIMIGMYNGKLVVELKDGFDDIASFMALTGYSQSDAHDVDIDINNKIVVPFGAIDEKKEFKRKEVKAEDVLYVRALGGKSKEEFYVSVIDDYDQHMIERDSLSILTRNAKHVPLSEMVKGKPVSIFNKYHYRYERAIINKVIDKKGKAEIEYIDLGGYETSSMYLMKDVPVGYFERPGAALLCSAEYIGEYDESLPYFMEPGYEFFVTVKEVGNAFEKPYILYPLSTDNELY